MSSRSAKVSSRYVVGEFEVCEGEFEVCGKWVRGLWRVRSRSGGIQKLCFSGANKWNFIFLQLKLEAMQNKELIFMNRKEIFK